MWQNVVFITVTEMQILLQLAMPLLLRFLIDDVLTAGQWSLFPNFAVMMAAVIVALCALNLTSNIMFVTFSENISATARNALFKRLFKKSLTFFHKTGDGDITERLMTSSTQLHMTVSLFLERLISGFAYITVTFVLIFTMHPPMALASLLAVPVFILAYIKSKDKMVQCVSKLRAKQAEQQGFYIDTVRNAQLVKNFTSEEAEYLISKANNAELKDLSIRANRMGAIARNIVSFATRLNQMAVLCYGGYLVYTGAMTVGTLVAFYTLLSYVYEPLVSIMQTLTDLNSSFVGMERYLEYDNEEYEEDYEGGKSFGEFREAIEFKDVSFAYTGKDDVLKNINLNIAAGDKILLSGKSGIGKSTTTSLLKRFYEVSSGAITVDGRNIKEINLPSLRQNIFCLSQSSSFYNATVRENFRRIAADMDDGAMWEALKKARIDTVLQDPDHAGLDTRLEKNAVTFSGGQRQRLNLALLFSAKARIVILDEPFSGLDKNTTGEVWEELKTFLKDRTAILIDHAPIDRQYFHRVFTMDNAGNITEEKSTGG
jgi:ABC-type bacteriocin/lantibiotic exporter with double-glycine peptidase domain